MCGINGITKNDSTCVERMNVITRHRGPDGSRVWEGDGITLGHNRLSIIDLREVASQPFLSNDGRYVLVYNGELYNFKELRAELSEYEYRTTGDTEVIMQAYRAWGPACVKRFNGIFAFAIWDIQTKELFLARDQFGVKPLYYHLEGEVCIFSSEAKAIVEAGIKPVLNPVAFSQYMQLIYTPGEETLFAGIKRLGGGHTMRFKNGQATIECYYKLPEGKIPRTNGRGTYHAKIESALDTAVARQLVADVPVGIYLSGGIDSTIVVDAATRQGGSIDTFSIGFDLHDNEESEKFNADYTLAEKTAHRYGTRHHAFKLTAEEMVPLIEDHVWHMDEPVANLTSLAQRKLAQYAKEDVSVVLGGDGGDELFGGYKRHGIARRLGYFWSLPPWMQERAPGYLHKAAVSNWSDRYLLFLAQKELVLEKMVTTPYSTVTSEFFADQFFKRTTNASFLDDMMRADLMSWLVDESLLRSDKMSMASGLEQRVPFLDLDVVSLARSIPASYKTTLFDTKKILKDSFSHRLPAEILHQPKRGWISPGAKWLRRPEVRAFVTEVLSPSYYAETAHLFKWDELARMYAAHCDRTEYHLTPLWSVVIFQVWARRFGVIVPK